eukprot:6183026-Pleurochrysis_carterae.AAC.2
MAMSVVSHAAVYGLLAGHMSPPGLQPHSSFSFAHVRRHPHRTTGTQIRLSLPSEPEGAPHEQTMLGSTTARLPAAAPKLPRRLMLALTCATLGVQRAPTSGAAPFTTDMPLSALQQQVI